MWCKLRSTSIENPVKRIRITGWKSKALASLGWFTFNQVICSAKVPIETTKTSSARLHPQPNRWMKQIEAKQCRDWQKATEPSFYALFGWRERERKQKKGQRKNKYTLVLIRNIQNNLCNLCLLFERWSDAILNCERSGFRCEGVRFSRVRIGIAIAAPNNS